MTACVLHLALEKAHQEHVKSTESNTGPLSPRASQTGAQFSRKLHAIVYCRAAAAHHTRVYALYLGWQLPATGIHTVIESESESEVIYLVIFQTQETTAKTKIWSLPQKPPGKK